SINRGRFAPDGERAMDLRRVAPETNGQLGDDHTLHADGARRGALPWNKAVGIIHLRRRDEMNSGVAAVLEVGAIDDGQDILLGHAGPELSLYRLAGEVGEIAASPQVGQLLFAAD